MKTKLVLWGANTQDERLLIALELLPEENKVHVYTFPEEVATEEFSQRMLNEWRDGQDLDFPEPHGILKTELNIAENLLPEGLKVEREDLLQRAQTEWQFVVLSAKLNETYLIELEELRERIERLEKFENKLWEELKGFWGKVQTQVQERNLFRDHANELRDKTNELFAHMKELRNRADEEFSRRSRENQDRLQSALQVIEERIEQGLRLQPIFDDLKKLQRKFRDAKLTREDRSTVWERLDAAFKAVKEKRFGTSSGDGRSPLDRLQRRFDGLLGAIDKMERSIKRDRDDLAFQNRKIENTDGQLEAQIRQAKIMMIQERIRSKEEKLGEMMQTRSDLEQRLEKLRGKEAQRAEQERLEEARRKAEEKIAEEIKQAAAARKEEEEKLEKAAGAISALTPGTTRKAGPAEDQGHHAEAKQTDTPDLKEELWDVVDAIQAVAEAVDAGSGEPPAREIAGSRTPADEGIEEAKD